MTLRRKTSITMSARIFSPAWGVCAPLTRLLQRSRQQNMSLQTITNSRRKRNGNTGTKSLCRVMQAAPVAFDRKRTLEKVRTLTAGAARQGVQIVVFPEAFVSAYPRGL